MLKQQRVNEVVRLEDAETFVKKLILFAELVCSMPCFLLNVTANLNALTNTGSSILGLAGEDWQ